MQSTLQIFPDKTINKLMKKSIEYRKSVIKLIYLSKAGHTGGSLSCVDILNVLYNHVMNITPINVSEIDRDHYIHSKGHSVEALYAVLMDLGFFTDDEMNTFEKFNSPFIGHPTRGVPGIEQNTGALGHGLSFSVGMALATKMDGRNNKVFTIMGDGELTEGSIWEASTSAAHYHLDNLVAIVDRNRLQITGKTVNVMNMEPLQDKFSAYGFAVRQVNGNDIEELISVFSELPFEFGKPNLIIANTIKGKGISFMEDNVAWHHRVPSDSEFLEAMQELEHAELSLENQ